MTQLGGSLRLGGSTALVSQTAFIMNDTVRENILFGSEYDEDRYNQVCQDSDADATHNHLVCYFGFAAHA